MTTRTTTLTRRGEVVRAVTIGAVTGFAAGLALRAMSGHWTHAATHLLSVVIFVTALGMAVWAARTAWGDHLEHRRRARTVSRLRRINRDGSSL